MPVDTDLLARALSGWVQFQAECGRKKIFSERLLADPIGQFLLAHHPRRLEVELPHPILKQRRVDFALRSADAEASPPSEIIETKFITPKRCFSQEICDDLVRLESASHEVPGCRGLFLVVGLGEHLKNQVVTEFGDTEELPPLQHILAGYQEDPHDVDIENAEIPLRKFWKASFDDLCGGEGPSKIRVSLLSQWPHEDVIHDEAWTCLIWEVNSVAPRQLCVPNLEGIG